MLPGVGKQLLTALPYLELSFTTHFSLLYRDLKSMLVTYEALRSCQRFNISLSQQSAVLADINSAEIIHS